jgi:4a-hydroxytetrahydrobiopterin dehydratase
MNMARSKMSDEAVAQKLAELEGWERRGERICRTFQFRNFIEAFGWMTEIALVAEKMDHHPDWKNVYRTVEVELWTHDAGGLTNNDFELAAEMNRRARTREARAK